ncbi:UBP-type zinc finger domain-containing protein [Sphaerisporangium dianthi]|uniref:UBP-type zinc finger domain-containing protein n=1 Tax=Sphaerisporangium dianthi TaxID=1436120 RepID=A0ABV9CU76_9ACTN
MTLHVKGMKIGAHGGLNGQAPRCDHAGGPMAAVLGAPECAPCLALGLTWTRLLVCVTCGWVACSDDSPGGHAKAHYQETDHPVVASLDPDTTWRWCYAHDRALDS